MHARDVAVLVVAVVVVEGLEWRKLERARLRLPPRRAAAGLSASFRHLRIV